MGGAVLRRARGRPGHRRRHGLADEHIFLAVTAGLLASALSAIPVGRRLDRHPRRVLVAAAAMGTLAMIGAALSPTIWTFAAAWILCGIAQAGALYQAAFTVITHRYGGARRAPLTLVTLAGGLASTIFAPLTGWLVLELGWRPAFLTLAGILAVTTLPAYACTIERRWAHGAEPGIEDAGAGRILRSVRFRALSAGFALMSFSLYAVTLSAVPASVQKGLDLQTASWVLGLIGAGQVLGRLVYLAVPHVAAPWIAPTLVGALGAVSLLVFAVASTPVGIFAAGVVAGAIRGALTLVQASAVADRWGTASYGRLNGALAAPVIARTALAPAAAATLAAALGKYSVVALATALVCAAGGALVIRR